MVVAILQRRHSVSVEDRKIAFWAAMVDWMIGGSIVEGRTICSYELSYFVMIFLIGWDGEVSSGGALSGVPLHEDCYLG